jgi:hypothetical protein
MHTIIYFLRWEKMSLISLDKLISRCILVYTYTTNLDNNVEQVNQKNSTKYASRH